MRLAICADGEVGLAVLRWLAEHHRQDVGLVVVTQRDNLPVRFATDLGLPTAVWEGSDALASRLSAGQEFDLGLLAWWPYVIKEPLISATRRGFVNFHPSLLPYNRGKHYNFWALVEQAPFGVTLHRVVADVDAGPILFQRPITYDWSDTGGTLFTKAQVAMVALFIETYSRLRTGDYAESMQDPNQGSFHLASELQKASVIELDATTTPRRILNLIRARTFPGKPACQFTDAGRTWEVRISITEKP